MKISSIFSKIYAILDTSKIRLFGNISVKVIKHYKIQFLFSTIQYLSIKTDIGPGQLPGKILIQ